MGVRTSPFPRDRGIAEFRTPLTIPGGDVAGAELVRELPAEFALPVWQALRCVLRWAEAGPAGRAGLFAAGEMEAWEVELLLGGWDEEARLPVAVIAGSLADAECASPERLARACLCVTDWALARGAVATALAFAEAAALAWPEQPRYAYTVGRLLRTHGRPREAEEWMKRVVRVGRRLEDWDAHTLGLNSLGNTYVQIGRYPQAIRTLRQALKLAQKHRLRHFEGEILHDLFVATWAAGDAEVADRYARAAFEHYRTGHARLPALAHDLAYVWVTKGYHSRALSILEHLPDLFPAENDRIRAFGSLARAAGGCGAVPVFERAAGEIRSLANRAPSTFRVASALVEMAIGAAALDRWEIAEGALAEAVVLAADRTEADVLARAEETLTSVRRRRPIGARSGFDLHPPQNVDLLVEGLLHSLQNETTTAGS